MNVPPKHVRDARPGQAYSWYHGGLLFLLCLSCSYVAVAAVVSMQPPHSGGGTLQIPVVVYGDGEEALAGVQFDLNYDPASYELVEVASGAAAADAGKEVILSQPAAGTGRVLITGFNDATMYDGHVATVVLRPRRAESAPHTLAVNRVLATDPLGYAVPIAYEDLYAFPPRPPDKIESREKPVEPDRHQEPPATMADSPGEASEAVAAGDPNGASQRPTSGGAAAATPHGGATGSRPGTSDVGIGAPTVVNQTVVRAGEDGVHNMVRRPGERGPDRERSVRQRSQANGTVPADSRWRPGTTTRQEDGRVVEVSREGRIRLALAAPAASGENDPGHTERRFDVLRTGGDTLLAGFSPLTAGVTFALGATTFALLVFLRTVLLERLVRRPWRKRP